MKYILLIILVTAFQTSACTVIDNGRTTNVGTYVSRDFGSGSHTGVSFAFNLQDCQRGTLDIVPSGGWNTDPNGNLSTVDPVTNTLVTLTLPGGSLSEYQGAPSVRVPVDASGAANQTINVIWFWRTNGGAKPTPGFLQLPLILTAHYSPD